MRKKVKKTISIIVGIIIVLIIIGLMLGGKRNTTPNATAVRIEEVKLGDLQEYISAPGEIEPLTQVEISAKISARVEKLPFEEGTQVKAGDILIQLDSKEMQSRLKSAEASYMAQKSQIDVTKSQIEARKAQIKGIDASLQQAQKDFERQKMLLASGDISQSVFDLARQKLDEMQSQKDATELQIQAEEQSLIVANYSLEAQKAQIEEAREALDYTTIRSPIDGVITRINAEVGEMVMTGTMNNPGTVIMVVADLSKMLLVAQVDEADVGKITVGQQANVRVKAYWDQVYQGVVDNIAMTNDRTQNNTKYYRTEILMQGDVSRLYTGLTADVDIITQKHTGVIKVFSQAVMARKTDDIPLSIRDKNPNIDPNKTDAVVVFRLVDGKAVITPVTIGPSDLTHIIVKSGLSVGDKVVVGPYKVLDGLHNDQLIKDEREGQSEQTKQQTSEPNTPSDSNGVKP